MARDEAGRARAAKLQAAGRGGIGTIAMARPRGHGSRSPLARAEAAAPPDRWATATFAELATTLGTEVPSNRWLAKATFNVRQVKAGEALHRAGDKLEAVYVVRAGCAKIVRFDGAGNAQVLGFAMPGDAIGLDAADLSRYTTDAIALDAGAVIVLPFDRLEDMARRFPGVERLLHGLFSREMVRQQRIIWLLGTLDARARVASFLLQLSERFGQLGYSRTSLLLPMTRKDVGSYLGLKLETVSRTLSSFAAAGLVDIDGKAVVLRDLDGLRSVVGAADELSRAKRRLHASLPAATAPASARVVQ